MDRININTMIINYVFQRIENIMIMKRHDVNTIIIDGLFQEIENIMIMNIFLDNIKDNIIKPIEYKIHPTASMIKESFVNINDGDILGFNKLHFLKCYMKTVHNLFLVSNKTEYHWNYLFNKLYLYDLEE